MYLTHFGLYEAPFRITPAAECFFTGAQRGEILDALLYAVNEGAGIIKLSGEVGSGKTSLCRTLIARLPESCVSVYLANPSLSREELLYAIADALDLHIDIDRVGIIMHAIQKKLETLATAGRRVIVIADEAHAMPPDTLEELRLLYNLQSADGKLLQLILCGQPELDAKLDRPNMRQLKDRIVHRFTILPLSAPMLEAYLMFRLHGAGYHGAKLFSPEALKLIASASSGLLRRVNILADKSLLAAFVENTHTIHSRHVIAAMRDSGISAPHNPRRALALAVPAALAVLAGLVIWWQPARAPLPQPGTEAPVIARTPAGTPVPLPATNAAPQPAPAPAAPPHASDTLQAPAGSLYAERLAAGRSLLATHHGEASIQLFYNEDPEAARIEGFLRRAKSRKLLDEIYLIPETFGNKQGLRALYGRYPTMEAAQHAIGSLPPKYREAFSATAIAL